MLRSRQEVIHVVWVVDGRAGEAGVGRGLQGENLACWWLPTSFVISPNKKI